MEILIPDETADFFRLDTYYLHALKIVQVKLKGQLGHLAKWPLIMINGIEFNETHDVRSLFKKILDSGRMAILKFLSYLAGNFSLKSD